MTWRWSGPEFDNYFPKNDAKVSFSSIISQFFGSVLTLKVGETQALFLIGQDLKWSTLIGLKVEPDKSPRSWSANFP